MGGISSLSALSPDSPTEHDIRGMPPRYEAFLCILLFDPTIHASFFISYILFDQSCRLPLLQLPAYLWGVYFISAYIPTTIIRVPPYNETADRLPNNRPRTAPFLSLFLSTVLKTKNKNNPKPIFLVDESKWAPRICVERKPRKAVPMSL